MKKIRILCFVALAACAGVLASPFVLTPVRAQDTATVVTTPAAAADSSVYDSAEAPSGAPEINPAEIVSNGPGWLLTLLSVYGAVAAGYQVLIGWWHKRIAETTPDTDDLWTQKLESATWFKVLDRIMYVGGYIGSWLGGKKL